MRYNEQLKKHSPLSFPIPILSIARSELKKLENESVARSIIDAITVKIGPEGLNKDITRLKNILIIGYGNIGKCVADVLKKRLGPKQIYICEKIEKNLNEAALIFTIEHVTNEIQKFLKDADLIITAASAQVLGQEEFALLKSGAIIACATSSDDQFTPNALQYFKPCLPENTSKEKSIRKQPCVKYEYIKKDLKSAVHSNENEKKINENIDETQGKNFYLFANGDTANFLIGSTPDPIIHIILSSICINAKRFIELQKKDDWFLDVVNQTQMKDNKLIKKKYEEIFGKIYEEPLLKLMNSGFNLPPNNTMKFIGRVAQLEKIHSYLKQSITNIQVLSGPCGAGKTATLLHFIQKYRKGFSLIIWFDASEDLHTQFFQLAKLLLNDNFVVENRVLPNNLIKEIYKKILSVSGTCILVFDNAIDWDRIKIFLPIEKEKYYSSNIKILITSKEYFNVNSINESQIANFTDEEALEFFKINSEVNIVDAKILISRFGLLPLALTKIVNLIKNSTLNISEFIELCNNRQTALFNQSIFEPNKQTTRNTLLTLMDFSLGIETIQKHSLTHVTRIKSSSVPFYINNKILSENITCLNNSSNTTHSQMSNYIDDIILIVKSTNYEINLALKKLVITAIRLVDNIDLMQLFSACKLSIQSTNDLQIICKILEKIISGEWTLKNKILEKIEKNTINDWPQLFESLYPVENDNKLSLKALINSVRFENREHELDLSSEEQISKIHYIYNNESTYWLNENKNINELKDKDFYGFKDYIVKQNDEKWVKKNILYVIAIISRAVEFIFSYKPLDTQYLAIIIFFNAYLKKQGCLGQIYTGEGKTLITAIFAIIQVLSGQNINVITITPALAIRDAENNTELCELFGIKVSNNCDEIAEQNPNERKTRYTCPIVYGDLSSFQGDILLTEYLEQNILGNRSNEIIIVDEVDSMLLDKGEHILYLSHEIPDLLFLNQLYSEIWHCVNKKLENIFFSVNSNQIEPLIEEVIKDSINSISNAIRIGQIKVPNYLNDFVNRRLKIWVRNAIIAKNMQQNDDYIKTSIRHQRTPNNDEIFMMDKDTGVTEINTRWNDGLHQFLQLKHFTKFNPESLKAVFMSNVGYFKRYAERIYGMTGTLGSKADQSLLKSIYGINLFYLPRYKKNLFSEEQEVLISNREEWINSIIQETELKINAGRSVLIICENIVTVEEVRSYLLKSLNNFKKEDIHTYTNSYEAFTVGNKNNPLSSHKIIIATNLAGRGTDLITDLELENNGGLHVVLTFLPKNVRVESQAFGRTARNGNKGSGKYILYKTYDHDLNKLRQLRDINEEQHLENIRLYYLPTIQFEERLFNKFTNLYKKIKKNFIQGSISIKYKKEYIDLQMKALVDHWAFWLDSMADKIRNVVMAGISEIKMAYNNFVERMWNIFNGKDLLKFCQSPVEIIQLGKYFANIGQSQYTLDCFNKVVQSEPIIGSGLINEAISDLIAANTGLFNWKSYCVQTAISLTLSVLTSIDIENAARKIINETKISEQNIKLKESYLLKWQNSNSIELNKFNNYLQQSLLKFANLETKNHSNNHEYFHYYRLNKYLIEHKDDHILQEIFCQLLTSSDQKYELLKIKSHHFFDNIFNKKEIDENYKSLHKQLCFHLINSEKSLYSRENWNLAFDLFLQNYISNKEILKNFISDFLKNIIFSDKKCFTLILTHLLKCYRKKKLAEETELTKKIKEFLLDMCELCYPNSTDKRIIPCEKENTAVILSGISNENQDGLSKDKSLLISKNMCQSNFFKPIQSHIQIKTESYSEKSGSMKNRVSDSSVLGRYGLFEHERKGQKEAKQIFKINFPEGFELSLAVGQGDCFYDAVAQGLNQLVQKDSYSTKSLRLLCSDYAAELDKACKNKREHEDNWLGKQFKDEVAYHHYMANVRYTAAECVEGLGLHNDGIAVWGEQHIDTVIICKKLGVKIHIMELQEVAVDDEGKEKKQIICHRLVDNTSSKSTDEINYGDKNTIHIAVYNNHFVPILEKNVNQKLDNHPHKSSQIQKSYLNFVN